MGIQVQELTHGLMPWQKEYIDFSFAGRHISEFGLVAVTSGDRYSFKGSPEFQDETSTVNGVWGQYYWGTNFKTITYEYSLATDGMTERQFEEFKKVFQPGKYGQFYEDTWFDRYCYVRIKNVVNFSFIPFEEETEIAGVKFQGRIYKGECKLSLVQDKPFKYAFQQVLDTRISELNNLNDNGEAALRMMYYSNIPALDSWLKTEKCATGSWINLPAKNSDDVSNIFTRGNHVAFYNPSTFDTEAKIKFDLKRTTTPINEDDWEPIYFNEVYDDTTNKITPYNVIGITDSLLQNTAINSYEAKRIKREFKYSLPEISSEINKAIKTAWEFYKEHRNGALADLQERIQENLVNGKVLLWAIRILQKIQSKSVFYYPENINGDILIDEEMYQSEITPIEEAAQTQVGTIYLTAVNYGNETFDEEGDSPGCLRTKKTTAYISALKHTKTQIEIDWFGYFNIMMLMMFGVCEPNEQEDILGKDAFTDFYPYTLIFNGEKGQAFTTYEINELNTDGVITKTKILEENCSNIIASDYLKVEGGDTIDISSGKIASYHLLRFKHGKSEDLTVYNIQLDYKYTYM